MVGFNGVPMKILCVQSSIYDYLTASLIEGLKSLGHDVACSEDSNYGCKIDDERMSEYAESADLIIVGSNVGVRSYLLNGVKNPRKVFVDGSDSQDLNVVNNIRFKAVFKRELNRNYYDAEKDFVYPLPFSAERRYFMYDHCDRDLLVTFLANMSTNPLRNSVHQRLCNQLNPRIISGTTRERSYQPTNSHSNPIETPIYRTLLRRSLISINVAGAGYDCARHWEILAAGALLFTQELDIVIPNGFTDGVDCVVFRSLDEFEERLNYYLKHEDLSRSIASRGYRRLLSYHTSSARAEYFLKQVARCIDRIGYCHRFLHPEMHAVESLCTGRGIDVGCRSSKTTPDCIGVDLTLGGTPGSIGCEAGRVSSANVVTSGDHLQMFEDESLDFVVARHNLEHYHDPSRTLREWKRVLKKGGRIGVIVPDHDRVDTYALDPAHYSHFTKASLAEVVRGVGGLRIERIGECIPGWSILGVFEKE
jgi:SAM-dependent methyltransferase